MKSPPNKSLFVLLVWAGGVMPGFLLAQGNSPTAPGRSSPADRPPLTPSVQEILAAHPKGKEGPPPVIASPGQSAAMVEAAARYGPASPDQAKARAKALGEAKVAAKGGDAGSAASKLSAFNHAKPGTAEWHLETHGQLLQLADEFSRSGKIAESKAVVAETLKQLASADSSAHAVGEKAAQARAKTATGRVQERYLGDPGAAIASYQAALALNPNDPGAKEAYDRLQRSYQNLLARTSTPKNPKK